MIIKHHKFMDVAFQVDHVLGPFGSDQTYKLKGTWVNQGFVNTYFIGHQQKIEIKTADLSHWSYCQDLAPACIRYSPWAALG